MNTVNDGIPDKSAFIHIPITTVNLALSPGTDGFYVLVRSKSDWNTAPYGKINEVTGHFNNRGYRLMSTVSGGPTTPEVNVCMLLKQGNNYPTVSGSVSQILLALRFWLGAYSRGSVLSRGNKEYIV